MNTRKILYVASYRGGGVEHFSRMLLDNLGADFETDLLLVARREGQPFAVKLADFARTIRRLVARLRTNRYDVIHLNPPFNRNAIVRDSIYLWITNRMGHADRTVVFFHGWDLEFGEKLIASRLYRAVFKSLYGKVATLFLFDEPSRDQLVRLGIDPARIHITTTMYESLQHASRRPDEDPRRTEIVFISRLVDGKGVEIAAETAQDLLKRGRRNFHLTIAGDGPLLAPLRRFVEDNDLGRHVSVPGYVSGNDKAALLSEGDILLLPTQLPEGCPVAIIEAMGAEQAIVSTPRGAIPLLVEHGVNGALCDSDDPRVFGEAIESLLDDRARLTEIQKANRVKAEQCYEAKDYAARMESVYDSLIGRRPGMADDAMAARAA